jgi:DNA-binding protein H-NS
MTSYADLKQQADELLRQAEELRAAERNDVLASVRATINEWGFTASDIGFKPAKKEKRKMAPKYRNAAGQEWCGRGAMPKWMRDEVGSGANKEDFLIAA